MSCRSCFLTLVAGVALSMPCASSRADEETDLLNKFQKQNQTAAQKLKQQAARVLSQGASAHADQDRESLQKVLGQLQEDRLLPREERTALVRQLQERLRLCKSITDKQTPPTIAAPTPAASDPKLRVSPATLILNGTTVNVPDGGVRVLGSAGFMSAGRNEGGVPGLGKLPYLGRGFRNVGFGTSIGTVQRPVSVRIISMEEEEARFLKQK
jgi:hypothetical protein